MSSSSKSSIVAIALIGVAAGLTAYVFLVMYDSPDKFVPSVFVGALACLLAQQSRETAHRRQVPQQRDTKEKALAVAIVAPHERLTSMLLAQSESGVATDPVLQDAIATNRVGRDLDGEARLSFVVLKLRPTLTGEVRREMTRRGIRPATLIELLAFMRVMVGLDMPAHFKRVVALGETFEARGAVMVPALEFKPFYKTIETLQMDWSGYDYTLTAIPSSETWGEDTALLAVIK